MKDKLVLLGMTKIQLSLAGEKSVDRSRKLVTSVKEFEFENEEEAQKLTTHLLDHLTSGVGRATWKFKR